MPSGVVTSLIINYCDVTARVMDYEDTNCITNHTEIDLLASSAFDILSKYVSR